MSSIEVGKLVQWLSANLHDEGILDRGNATVWKHWSSRSVCLREIDYYLQKRKTFFQVRSSTLPKIIAHTDALPQILPCDVDGLKSTVANAMQVEEWDGWADESIRLLKNRE